MITYLATLIDGTAAEIQLEEVEGDINDLVMMRTSEQMREGAPGIRLDTPVGKVWQYTILIDEGDKRMTELYGRGLGCRTSRAALNHAWKRLDREEGLMPGCVPVAGQRH